MCPDRNPFLHISEVHDLSFGTTSALRIPPIPPSTEIQSPFYHISQPLFAPVPKNIGHENSDGRTCHEPVPRTSNRYNQVLYLRMLGNEEDTIDSICTPTYTCEAEVALCELWHCL